MNSLFLINETYTNGFIPSALDIISFLAILSGIFVIISKNPIISILYLIGLFLSISSYLILSGLNFIGLSYLVVYIGAVSILFLFILMLINIRISELQSNTSNSITLSIIMIISFNYIMFQLLPYNILNLNSFTSFINKYFYFINLNKINDIISNNFSKFTQTKNLNNEEINSDLLFVTSKTWDGNLAENDHITAIGNIMYTNYNIWLIIASYILLLAMVGAIVITIKQKN